VVVIATVVADFRAIVDLLGGAAIPSALLITVAAFGIGYALVALIRTLVRCSVSAPASATSRRRQ
jgi:hypothetical protein